MFYSQYVKANSVHLRSTPQITEKSCIRYERFLNKLLVSFLVRVNLMMTFSGPHSLVDTKTTGFESLKTFDVSFCSSILNIQ